jgi:lysozyme
MSVRNDILTQARARLGIPYRLDPPPDGVNNLDCSLYVLKVYEAAGVPFSGVRTAEQIRQACGVVGWGDVQPGDLLFFEHTYEPNEPPGPDGHTASHIGISLGTGTRRMFSAVEPVSKESDISSTYWQQHLLEARRAPQLTGAQPTPTAVLEGIDVSSWQGKPDWAAVAAAGYAFGIVKATEGLDYINPDFLYDWNGMRGAGMVRGSYHWGDPTQSADQQARFFLDTTGPLLPGDMLMLDGEEGDGDVGAWALAFLQALEARAGFIPLCYTGRWFSDPHGFPQHPELARYPLVAAAYQDTEPAPIPPWTKITIWQRSSTGTVPGIIGNVDLDRFYGTRAELLALGKPGVVDPLATWRGTVGSGILDMMRADGTVPVMASTWLPLGRGAADAEAEEGYGVNGTRYLFHLPSQRSWRYPSST